VDLWKNRVCGKYDTAAPRESAVWVLLLDVAAADGYTYPGFVEVRLVIDLFYLDPSELIRIDRRKKSFG
jgi:hypothetical protein